MTADTKRKLAIAAGVAIAIALIYTAKDTLIRWHDIVSQRVIDTTKRIIELEGEVNQSARDINQVKKDLGEMEPDMKEAKDEIRKLKPH